MATAEPPRHPLPPFLDEEVAHQELDKQPSLRMSNQCSLCPKSPQHRDTACYTCILTCSAHAIPLQSLEDAETVSLQTAKKKVQLAEDAWNTW